ncbi:hypothetical protein ACWGLF_01815 [Streptomyces puniciscabiei]
MKDSCDSGRRTGTRAGAGTGTGTGTPDEPVNRAARCAARIETIDTAGQARTGTEDGHG